MPPLNLFSPDNFNKYIIINLETNLIGLQNTVAAKHKLCFTIAAIIMCLESTHMLHSYVDKQ